MSCGKCGCMKLCPVSFGLALGLVCGLAIFIWTVWIMYYGVSPVMAQYQVPLPTLKDAVVHALWGLLKGFVFGFFVALFYDLIACCGRKWCCKKSGSTCACCASQDKPEVK